MDNQKLFEARKQINPNNYDLNYNYHTPATIKRSGKVQTKSLPQSPNLRQLRKNTEKLNELSGKKTKEIKKLADGLKLIQASALLFVGNLIKAKKEEKNTIVSGGVTETIYNKFVAPSKQSSGKLSSKGLEYIMKKEKFSATPYKATKAEKYLTIGYGHYGADVKPNMKITKEEAMQLLKNDIKWAEDVVNNNVTVPLTQNQFDALVSFVFNTGPNALPNSTLLKKLNSGDYKGAAAEFDKWVKDDSKKTLPGLVKRRAEEKSVFLSDIPKSNQTTPSNIKRNKLEIAKTTNKVGQYALNKGVQLSTQMLDYLNRVGGSGRITSGMETTVAHAVGSGKGWSKEKPKPTSHYYGLKLDVVPFKQTDEEWAKLAVPFILDNQTEVVNFEAFTKDEFNRITEILYTKYPNTKKHKNKIKLLPANKNTTGKHLDIKIKEVKNISSNVNVANKNEEKLKQVSTSSTIIPTEKSQPIKSVPNAIISTSKPKDTIDTGIVGKVDIARAWWNTNS